MSPPIVFDLLRLFLSASVLAPRGIDRVDLAYARFLFQSWPGDCLGLLPTPWGLRLHDRRRVLRILDAIEALWRENTDAPDMVFAQLLCRFDGATADATGLRSNNLPFKAASRFIRLITASGVSLGMPAARNAPEAAIYLNIGQLGWAAPWMVGWLRRRPDIRAVFLLHDAIPIERPDLVTPMGTVMYRRMAAVASRHADGLIFTTQAAAESVLRMLPPLQRPRPITTALHLPVAPSFLARNPQGTAGWGTTRDDAELSRQMYFVVVGAIEPRKNLGFLLNVWQELARRRGTRTPHLVVVGSPARGSRPILRALQASGAAGGRIIVLSGLSSPALRLLVTRARALLMPSLAEGFGLPIVEALSVGTPVLASSLPAHREVGGELTIYIDPADAAGWLREIDRFTDGDDATRQLRSQIATYSPITPADYFVEISKFLDTFGGSSSRVNLKSEQTD